MHRRSNRDCITILPQRFNTVIGSEWASVSCDGLAAVLALAARCGLAGLVSERVQIAAKGGANAAAKIVALVAGWSPARTASLFDSPK